MSQAKVDKYKELKANRKKIMARQKAGRIAGTICGWAVLIALVGWIGYSAYNWYQTSRPAKTIYVEMNEITDYISSLAE